MSSEQRIYPLVERRCPTCLKSIRFSDLLENVRCPFCKDVFPPEYARPLETHK